MKYNMFQFKFNLKFFFVFAILFIIEVIIALYINDAFIRPYLGDVLVVILLFCLIRSFLYIPTFPLVIAVLLFSYLIEFLQFFQVTELLNLQDNRLMRIVLGSVFSWGDIMCYTIGALICYGTQYFPLRK